MLWLHYAAIVALFIAITAKYISPALFWIPAFFGLAFPHLFVLSFLFLVYWLAQLKPVIVAGVIALLAGIPTAYRFVQVSMPASAPKNKTLKITSYNSMLFDLYNWGHNRSTRARILASLSEIDPDILCLQEFYTSEERGDFNNADTISRLLRMPYRHAEYTVTLRKFDHWGIATFSRYPIARQGKIMFNTRSNNICIFTDILLGADTIRVYNVHLQSISFSRQDNKFLEEVLSHAGDPDEVAGSRNILRRLKRAFLKRTAQVDMIAAHMRTCPYPIVLCGDFNDTAGSYAYETLSKSLNDAFIEKGAGIGRTYAGRWPQFRIDYILHDKRLRCFDYQRTTETFTDHYPITAFFDSVHWSK